jgi:putative membrane protein
MSATVTGAAAMLWIKTFHVLFVMSWMAGIFYLPRIFVHYSEGRAAGEDVRRLVTMSAKLYGFMTIMAILALVFGTWLWHASLLFAGLWWLQAKLVLVAGIVAYHLACRHYVRRMKAGGAFPTGKALRWFNEVPLLLLVPILYLVIAKPG